MGFGKGEQSQIEYEPTYWEDINVGATALGAGASAPSLVPIAGSNIQSYREPEGISCKGGDTMTLAELKLFLRIDGTEYDAVLPTHQLMAEKFLTNAGVTKDYNDAQYKILVSVVVGRVIEDPTLISQKGDSSATSLISLIAQLRESQVTA